MHRRAIWTSCLISAAYGCVMALEAFCRSDYGLFAGILLTIPFLASFIWSIFHWARSRPRLKALSWLPFVLALTAPFIGARTGVAVGDIYLRSQIPRLTQIVKALPSDWKSSHPAASKPLQPIISFTDGSGERVVYFSWGGGFPVKHQLLVYLQDSRTLSDPDFHANWPIIRKLQNHWYVVLD